MHAQRGSTPSIEHTIRVEHNTATFTQAPNTAVRVSRGILTDFTVMAHDVCQCVRFSLFSIHRDVPSSVSIGSVVLVVLVGRLTLGAAYACVWKFCFCFYHSSWMEFRIGNAMVRHNGKIRRSLFVACVCVFVCVWEREELRLWSWSLWIHRHRRNSNVITGNVVSVWWCAFAAVHAPRMEWIYGVRRLWLGISTRLCCAFSKWFVYIGMELEIANHEELAHMLTLSRIMFCIVLVPFGFLCSHTNAETFSACLFRHRHLT